MKNSLQFRPNLNTICILLILLVHFKAGAQPKKSIGWIAKTIGAGEENCSGVATDIEGNVYAIFRYNGNKGTQLPAANGNFEIAANPDNYGGSNTLLCSYTSDGYLRWAIKFEGVGTVAGWSLSMGQDQNLYVSGNFNRNAIFYSTDNKVEALPERKTVNNNYFYQFFTVKYNLNGALQWLKHGHSQDNMVDFKSVTDKNGNCYSYIHSAGQNVMIDDFVMSFKSAKPQFTAHYNVIIPKVTADGTTAWCFIGGKHSPLYNHHINAQQELELIMMLEPERNYFFNTNGWDTLIDAPSKEATYAKITLTSTGTIARVLPIFNNVQHGRLLDYITTETGTCAVFSNSDFPQRYSKNRTIVLGSDIINTTTDDDLFVVFFDQKDEIVNYFRMDGDQNQKFCALHKGLNGKIYVGFLATPNTNLWQKDQQLTALTQGRKYAYYIERFSSQGTFESSFFAGNYGYSGYEKHLHIATYGENIAVGVELGMASTIAGVEEEIDGYNAANGDKIETTDAALLFIKDIDQPSLAVNLNLAKQKTIPLLTAISFVSQTIAKVQNRVDTLINKIDVPNKVLLSNETQNTVSNPSTYDVFLFPNPVSAAISAITVRFQNMAEMRINWVLVAVNGNQLQSGVIQVASTLFETQLRFEGLNPGLYFINFEVAGERITKRLVVF